MREQLGRSYRRSYRTATKARQKQPSGWKAQGILAFLQMVETIDHYPVKSPPMIVNADQTGMSLLRTGKKPRTQWDRIEFAVAITTRASHACFTDQSFSGPQAQWSNSSTSLHRVSNLSSDSPGILHIDAWPVHTATSDPNCFIPWMTKIDHWITFILIPAGREWLHIDTPNKTAPLEEKLQRAPAS